MATISAKVSKKELDAIREYANSCGETMSNLIRKVMIWDATMMDCFHDSKEFAYSISIPEGVSGEEENRLVETSVNKIRRILDLDEIEI